MVTSKHLQGSKAYKWKEAGQIRIDIVMVFLHIVAVDLMAAKVA